MRLPILMLAICCQVLAMAQSKPIQGRVLDTEQQPVSGATVSIPRSGEVTNSDAGGLFKLNSYLPGDTLLIKAMGYETLRMTPDANASFISSTLTISTKELEEVTIHTGYEDVPRERLTGSFSRIDSKLFNEQVGTNVLDRLGFMANGLSGNTAAITASGATSSTNGLVVRGLSTLTKGIASPLIILDNFPYEGDLDNINPNDVETITVLKDAAAASIWGARAGNGVIVITTKNGKYSSPVRVNLSMNSTWKRASDLYTLQQLDAETMVDFEKFLFEKNYNLIDTASSSRVPLTEVYHILLNQRRGRITAAEADAQLNQLKGQDIRKDLAEYMYQPALSQQYSISVNGGGVRHSWLMSAGWDENRSELDAVYRRTTMRWTNNFQVTPRLQLGANVGYTQSHTRNGRPGFGDIQFEKQALPIYTKLVNDAGEAIPLYNKYNREYIDTAGSGLLLDWRYFPLTDYKHSSVTSQLTDINANFSINYKLGKSIVLDLKYRYQQQIGNTADLKGLGSFYTRDMINLYSQVNYTTGRVTYPIPVGDIMARSNQRLRAQDLRFQINFNRSWGSHSVSAIAGGQLNETVNIGDSYRVYGYNADYLTSSDVDQVNRYRTFVTGAQLPIGSGMYFSRTDLRQVSMFSNAAYTFKNRYALSFSARRDASNLFGVTTNNKWKPLLSSGLSWNISSEPFFSSRFINSLKFRATFGTQGNSDPTRVAVTTFRYSNTPNNYIQTPYSELENPYNSTLRWEQVAMLNLGLEFSILNNRLKGSIEFYQKYISDLYATTPTESTWGIRSSSVVRNIGEMSGKGWDIEINSLNIDGKLKWKTQLILNYNDHRMTSLFREPLSSSVASGGSMLGYSAYGYFAYKWGGLDPQTGDPIGFVDKSPSKDYQKITSDNYPVEDLVFVGSRVPLWFGSIGNNIDWGRWSLSARMIFKLKYYFKRSSISYNRLVSSKNGHSDYLNRWQQPGDELHTSIPSFVYPANSARDNFYLNSEVLATRGDHIRLQYINLSYQLPAKQRSKALVKEMSLFMVVNNVGIMWRANDLGLDPDNFNGAKVRKSYSLGARFQF